MVFARAGRTSQLILYPVAILFTGILLILALGFISA